MAAPARTPDTAPRPLRITPRGRRVLRAARWTGLLAALVVVAVVVVVLASSLLAPGAVAGDWSAAQARAAGDPGTVTVTVAPGDTLWGLAQRHAPDRDPREFIAEVYRINDLPESGLVRAGDELLVPVS